MEKLLLDTIAGKVYSDLIIHDKEQLIYANAYHANYNVLSSATATLNLGAKFWIYKYNKGKTTEELEKVVDAKSDTAGYNVFFESKEIHNQIHYAAAICNKDIVTRNMLNNLKGKPVLYILCDEDEDTALFNVIFNRYNIPMLKEFIPYIKRQLMANGNITALQIHQANGSYPKVVKAYRLDCPEEDELKDIIYEGFQCGIIKLADTPQKNIDVNNLDSYMEKFGGSIIDHVDKVIKPLMPQNKDIVDAPLKRRPFVSQARRANGMTTLLSKESFGFFISTMGCGKTLKSLATVEEYNFRNNKKSYRTLIMCPGHLQTNWEDEIKMTVPGAKIKILENLKDVQRIVYGPKPKEKIFYIIGKDFLKLSYAEIPVVKWESSTRYECIYKTIKKVDSENNEVLEEDGSNTYVLDLYENEKYVGKKAIGKKKIRKRGWICPDCGEVLYTKKSYEMYISSDDESILEPLDKWAFSTKKEGNQFCCHCGAKLWEPKMAVLNTGAAILSGKPKDTTKRWIKVAYKTGYTGTEKTAFVYEEFLEEFKHSEDNKVRPETFRKLNECESRRIAPMDFLKVKGYKNLFDFVIFDEVHKYANQSGQGAAMQVLTGVSKKKINLTGTLFNGKAESIWYLLWRLCPERMIKKGYKFDSKSLLEFNQEYGATEETYEYDSHTDYLATVRAKRIGSSKTIPGISPKLYQEFLIDNCIFMDLKDIENEEGKRILPPFDEQLVNVKMDEELYTAYKGIESKLLQFIRSKQKGSKAILGTMLQTLIAYPDIPTGWRTILNPYDGSIVATLKNLHNESLYNKEKKLLEIVKAEVRAGRRCLIFCTSTNKHDVQPRLEKILQKERIVAKTMYSSTPSSKKRKEWIKTQVNKGCQVLICNPELVETGLTLLEFPTIIYLQTGYVLSTLWQSSRRSWRIGQKKRVKVFYLAYETTLQERAIKLMGSKLKAAASIQGEFSSEGIQALSQNTNILTQLAEELHARALGQNEESLATIWDDSEDLLKMEEIKPIIIDEFKEEGIQPSLFEDNSTKKERRVMIVEKNVVAKSPSIFKTIKEVGIKFKGKKAPTDNQLVLFDL
jgi:SNF2 family DNA or RNA helicase